MAKMAGQRKSESALNKGSVPPIRIVAPSPIYRSVAAVLLTEGLRKTGAKLGGRPQAAVVDLIAEALDKVHSEIDLRNMPVRDLMRVIMVAALRECKGDVYKASELLSMNPRSFKQRAGRYEIDKTEWYVPGSE